MIEKIHTTVTPEQVKRLENILLVLKDTFTYYPTTMEEFRNEENKIIKDVLTWGTEKTAWVRITIESFVK